MDQVARELEMSKDGIYKLIQRGKLKAIRVSERNIRVSEVALDAYRRRVSGEAKEDVRVPTVESPPFGELLATFIADTGRSPEQWCEAWKRDQIEDSAENQRRTMAALALSSWESLDDTKRAASAALVA